ncbi:tripartite tricarboxylate transporter substrate binding protein [Bradyrhizobium sp.]|uniref:Bug family tripartite tricarboxylate transporter substrate binding protein n=1 Tax=Bradyrhizobium sp. TaxID=376 RepID=UPI002D4967D4|nr:tripartite tricarboxylate transporter substrate binding protein [Bradyrhizobium sp.]HZR72992.1 tripartite tricarboxylate transporter substrate binding protein [Bradyrhizobium sp.]
MAVVEQIGLRRPERSLRWVAVLAFVLTALTWHPSRAGEYPERTIKIVVPFPAGGPTDVAARLIAQSLATKFGKGVVVENHPGAGGRIGAKVVATATPDGYTLLLGGTNVNAIGAIYTDLTFDPVKSFAPIGVVCVDSLAIAISPRVPANDFKEFVAYAKSHPGQLKYGASPGIYTQFAGEYFKLKTGTDILFVPYKGGAPAVTDALGGHIEMVVNNKSNLLPQFKDGGLKALAVTSAERWPEMPQTPTMREVGILGFPEEVLFGLLAPAGTPRDIVMKLNSAINEALQSADVRASLEGIGVDARIGTPEAFTSALDEQAREWKRVIEETGIQVE